MWDPISIASSLENHEEEKKIKPFVVIHQVKGDGRRCKHLWPWLFTDPPFVLNTCGLCGFLDILSSGSFKKPTWPSAGAPKKKKRRREKKKELKHDSLLLPSPWALGFLPFTQGYSVWACVGLESVQPSSNPAINIGPQCLRLTDSSCEFPGECDTEVLIQSVSFLFFFFFSVWLFYFTCDIVYICWQSGLVSPGFNSLSSLRAKFAQKK